MIIDFHTHCFPDGLASRAMAALECGDLRAHHNGTIDGLNRSRQEADIDLVVIQPVATKPSQVRSINQWAQRIQGPGVLAFAAFHPQLSDWEAALDEITAYGFQGIKLHPDYQGFFVDDDLYFPLYEAIFQRDLILTFHAGVDACLPPPYHCTPTRLRRVIDHFPTGKIVAAHFGGFQQWEEARVHLFGRDIYLDTSYTLPFLSPQKVREMIYSHRVDRILFGTDSPWTCQTQALKLMERLALPPEDQAQIMGWNAYRLLKLKEEEHARTSP
ncbi:MAG: amidohydrolase family protein [Limnochordia bacterium]|jgi:predicted TIM-barrel fold metal-dependent hydrolase